jgi:Xaa-Pro aminopeptidase
MTKYDLEALIAFGDQNDFGYVTYLANFEPFMGRVAVIVTADKVSLVTDSAMHGEPMHSLIWKTWIENVRVAGHSYDSFSKELKTVLSGVKSKIGVAGTYSFPAREFGLNVVDVERPFLEMKSRKTVNELKVMKEAARITSCGMQAAVEAAKKGVREIEIAAVASKVMYEEGAPRLAFHPIVVAGPRAGTKHDFPSKRIIEDGDMVYLDMGAMWNGYFCDMSRTVLIGKGDAKQRDALDSILEIYYDLKKRIRPGVISGEVARTGEELAKSKGWLEDFWAMGHGLGTGFLEIPMLTPTCQDVFESRMVFAYEPMFVRLGLGTAVVEDTVTVTDSGCESLTECERKLW